MACNVCGVCVHCNRMRSKNLLVLQLNLLRPSYSTWDWCSSDDLMLVITVIYGHTLNVWKMPKEIICLSATQFHWDMKQVNRLFDFNSTIFLEFPYSFIIHDSILLFHFPFGRFLIKYVQVFLFKARTDCITLFDGILEMCLSFSVSLSCTDISIWFR